MKIKDIEFKNNIFLAPMAGVTDVAFRSICIDFGADAGVTEMISAKALTYNNKKTEDLLITAPNEHIKIAQIFGSDPVAMSKVCASTYLEKFDIIDINMGCPAPKIVNNGEGSFLMTNLDLARSIIESCVKATNKPITVKFRSGFDSDHINAVEFAKMCEKAGASAITIHGRTRTQQYSGKVDLDIIKQVKDSVKIPVIASGDVVDKQTFEHTMKYTGCDAIMIGRGALGNPWVFSRINAYLSECRVLPEPSTIEKMNVMLKHIQKIIEYKGEYTAMREARHHAAYYTKGMRGGAKLRAEISKYEHFEQLQELSYRIIKEAKL